MDKVEWGAMEQWQKDYIVSCELMGWGELVDFEYTKAHYDLGNIPKHTTDRNACVLVLDEIEERDREFVFAKILADELNVSATGRWNDFAISIRRILTVDPDTICYCALKALE